MSRVQQTISTVHYMQGARKSANSDFVGVCELKFGLVFFFSFEPNQRKGDGKFV